MYIISEQPEQVENLDARHYIIVKGARVNNLKNIDVAIPRNKLVVITGLSGSGKSSLAFDTIFAEGQRMYVESLSSYARQFVGRIERPDVEYIKGISPAIAVEQKGNSKNPRATVGTTTEVYDYLKLLFARIGKTYSPISGNIVKKDSVTDVVNYIQTFENGTRFLVLAPLIVQQGRTLADELKILFQKGFTRIIYNEQTVFIEEFLDQKLTLNPDSQVFILIDRGVINHQEEDNQFRIADSVQTAFYEGYGTCIVEIVGKEKRIFSDKFELDGITFEEPSVAFFSFNNPYGACKRCGGLGNVTDIDENLVIPNPNLSLYEGAIVAWETEKMQEWKKQMLQNSKKMPHPLPIHRPYKDLTEEEKSWVWNGTPYFEGINAFFRYVESQLHKIQYRVMLARYKGRITCPECKGTRLRKDAGYVKINQKSIIDLVLMPIDELLTFFENLTLSDYDQTIAKRILVEIHSRLSYLNKVGLGYLTLNRLVSTLSGGEYQRIKLATALGSALVGSMYVLDEPSIGLHPRDTARLVSVLKDLRDLGNTVIVVEHEEEVMRAADQIIDIGLGAGALGGNVVFQGKISPNGQPSETNQNPNFQSYTIDFLTKKIQIPIPTRRRQWTKSLRLAQVRANNLKNIDVEIPLGVFCVVTGVSGSGKSTLIKDVLYPALLHKLHIQAETHPKHQGLTGDIHLVKGVELIDQNPIGKSSRSNPATYTKVYDIIRTIFAEQALAKQRGYEAGHFSFNSGKGRCEACQGEGIIHIEMQFLADVQLTCEACQGKRFKKEILEVTYQDKNITEILNLTIDEALTFFKDKPRIVEAIKPLAEVGLGYIRLGQSTSTLSGGEAQRLKLASFLDKKYTQNQLLFIFDEPTTGLHFYDIQKLLYALQTLVEKGNSVIVIEHNLEIIKCADWIIDLGPDSGDKGGYITFAGTPENLIKQENNFTAKYLKTKFEM
ncbi:MAG: excinuclease ABC subunit UvrA [Microscillaceae bacterium]|nr:excinuclease ABC subunit UvrA [Microscillaceae bacterium]MDW8461489.1 excinuclease ABC subunit UvrA [Cytophagales bacterium]